LIALDSEPKLRRESKRTATSGFTGSVAHRVMCRAFATSAQAVVSGIEIPLPKGQTAIALLGTRGLDTGDAEVRRSMPAKDLA